MGGNDKVWNDIKMFQMVDHCINNTRNTHFKQGRMLVAVLGPVIAMDPVLSASGWAGAFLIFSGDIFLTLRKAKR